MSDLYGSAATWSHKDLQKIIYLLPFLRDKETCSNDYTPETSIQTNIDITSVPVGAGTVVTPLPANLPIDVQKFKLFLNGDG